VYGKKNSYRIKDAAVVKLHIAVNGTIELFKRHGDEIPVIG